ncbi:MAG: class I SAM-dependent methyltransferase [Sulfurimonas sp.]|jgi:SAM-dependent methyltransferase
MGSYKNSKCRICSSEKLTKVLELNPSPVADSYISKEQLNLTQELFEMDVFLCSACGLAQLLTIVHPEDIYIDYLYKTTTSVGLPQHFLDSASSIINKYDIEKESFIVDIGSNIGSLLSGYQNLGMKVLGIDPAVAIAKEATSMGIETLPIFFTSESAKEIVNKYGKAKIINSNNMMANIDTINDVVKGIKTLLAEDGVFVMETSYILHLIDNMVFDTIYHEHLSYFGLKPLQYLFEKNGLKIVDAEIVETKGGSLKCFVEHNKNQEVSPNVLEIMNTESSRNLYEPQIFTSYMNKINIQKNLMLEALQSIVDEGKTVYGYGASNTTTTLLHHFGISKYFDYIIDDNVIKIGRYSPNFHIPVVASDIIYENKPDYIVIFAWRFADIIMSQHQRFLDNGGKFIIPLPTYRVVG